MIYRGYTCTEVQPGKWELKREGYTTEYVLGSDEAVMTEIDHRKKAERLKT